MNKEKLANFLEDLGIDETGEIDQNRYVLQLEGSDEYARYYTILDHCEDLELSDTSSMSEEFATVLTYVNDDYKVKLNANFEDDYYTFTVEEIESK